jgi:NAD(P)-dependent dehydrogenase (short-subunit alcohol dehydrogenase family)
MARKGAFLQMETIAPTMAAMKEHELDGKVAIVTGAARALGRALAVALASNGADVVVHHHGGGSTADADETARLIRAAGARAHVVAGDLAEVATVKRLFDEAFAAFGRVDIVVNNAGAIVKKPILEVTEADFDRSFAINAKAAFFVMQEAARRIADGGRVINVGTSLLAATAPGYAVYAGSKAPLEDFTRALAREIGARGVTVNTIAPGPLDTAFYHSQENAQSVAYASKLAVAGRLGTPDDVAPVVAFLASPRSQWVTAQTIFVNGGYLSR